jgi:hypothetical protein
LVATKIIRSFSVCINTFLTPKSKVGTPRISQVGLTVTEILGRRAVAIGLNDTKFNHQESSLLSVSFFLFKLWYNIFIQTNKYIGGGYAGVVNYCSNNYLCSR